MSEQLSLTPQSHTTDPLSSYEAAERAPRQTHGEIVLDTVTRHPGRTAKELAGYCRLTQHQIARRTLELKNKGLIRMGYIRECTVEGGEAVTWWGK